MIFYMMSEVEAELYVICGQATQKIRSFPYDTYRVISGDIFKFYQILSTLILL